MHVTTIAALIAALLLGVVLGIIFIVRNPAEKLSAQLTQRKKSVSTNTYPDYIEYEDEDTEEYCDFLGCGIIDSLKDRGM